MRLDKYLKVSRLVKRRTVADQLCTAGRVQVNGRPAKSGYQLEVGDEIVIGFGQGQTRVRVLELRENVRKNEVSELYEVLESSREGDENAPASEWEA